MGFIIPCAILFGSPTSVGLVHETVLFTHIKIKEQQNLRKTESQWHSRDKVMLNKDYCQPLFLDSSFYEDVGAAVQFTMCLCTHCMTRQRWRSYALYNCHLFQNLNLLRSIMRYMALCILIICGVNRQMQRIYNCNL